MERKELRETRATGNPSVSGIETHCADRITELDIDFQ